MDDISVKNPEAADSKVDWRVGRSMTPKMRTHPYFRLTGVVRRIFPKTSFVEEHMEIELFGKSDDTLLALYEPTDEWIDA